MPMRHATLVPGSAEKDVMTAFWDAYCRHRARVDGAILAVVGRMPEMRPVVEAMSAPGYAEQAAANQELIRGAVLGGDWPPYLASLEVQGRQYASMDVTLAGWLEVITTLRRELIDAVDGEPDALQAVRGLGRYLDVVTAAIGEAYVHQKQDIIAEQQASLLELSTPILQVRGRMLLAPLVGAMDARRMEQVEARLLDACRQHRAQVVVLDVTGVAVVDTRVGAGLGRLARVAKLVGAEVIVSGISSEIAKTVVELGLDLPVPTAIDLRAGIELAEDRLAVGC